VIDPQAFGVLAVIEKCKQKYFSVLFVYMIEKGVVFVDDGFMYVFIFGGAGKNAWVLLNGLNYYVRFSYKLNNFSFIPVFFQIVQHLEIGNSGFC